MAADGRGASRRGAIGALIAGLASGAFMASVFVSVGVLMAFALVKDPPPAVAVTVRYGPKFQSLVCSLIRRKPQTLLRRT